jgi:short-subunit dehydrogenase
VEINGTSALVTGASGGIGRAIAALLHGAGSSVIVTGRRSGELEKLCTTLGERARPVVADLAKPIGVAEIAREVADVDILVFSAALPASGPLDGFTQREIERAVLVNFTAPMAITAACLPGLIARRKGHVVFVSSLAGKIPAPGSAIYNGTKAALRVSGLSLRDDLRGTGVGVSVIYPGLISQAGMWAETGLEPPRGIRTRTPDQVAAAVVRAIRRNKAELDVAPLPLRVTARVASLAPLLVLDVNRRAGYQAIADGLSIANRDKR